MSTYNTKYYIFINHLVDKTSNQLQGNVGAYSLLFIYLLLVRKNFFKLK